MNIKGYKISTLVGFLISIYLLLHISCSTEDSFLEYTVDGVVVENEYFNSISDANVTLSSLLNESKTNTDDLGNFKISLEFDEDISDVLTLEIVKSGYKIYSKIIHKNVKDTFELERENKD